MSFVRGVLLLLGGLMSSLPAGAGQQQVMGVGVFWPLVEYLRAHPGQEALSARLARRVAEPARPVTPRLERPLRIAVVYPGVQISDYWWRSLSVLRARLDELDLPYQLDTYLSGPGVNAVDQQLDQVRQALESDPDYLIYTLSTAAQKAIVERLLARGRPRVILQNITTPVRDWAGMQPLLYVGFDHAQGSRLLAAELRGSNEAGGYAMLLPDRALLGRMRGDPLVEALNGSRLQLREVYVTGFDAQRIEAATRDALTRHADLRLLVATTTDLALGALRVRDEPAYRRRSLLVSAWGGGEAELAALMQGRLDLTVMRHNDDNGVAMAEAIALDAQGRSHEVPTVFAGGLSVLTRETARETLRALAAHAFRYSGVPEGLK
ncbi:MAG: hypothetical protein RBT55_10120 [Rhodocyclaceae bacterium]|nr:hypothetical protein [Rhodocyclaceae bacterium]